MYLVNCKQVHLVPKNRMHTFNFQTVFELCIRVIFQLQMKSYITHRVLEKLLVYSIHF